jgi:bla regulator protein blaR1
MTRTRALRHLAPALIAVWAAGAIALTTWRWGQWRRVSGLMHAATPVGHGREAAALARAQPLPTAHGIAHVLVSQAGFEPAVLGIFRPALLWPAGLSRRLADAHLDAIVAHELCHVRRRDNLSALVHVVVEVLFWFHPLVWWLGARLVTERERACDEEVLQMGTDRCRYAEAILKVCHFSLRAPAALAAGVGGAGLSRRIARILSGRTPPPLTNGARVLLASVAVLAAAAPPQGVLDAQRAMPGGGLRGVAWAQAGTPEAAQASRDVLRPAAT